MDSLSQKEVDILRFIRTSRHKTTVAEIAKGLRLPHAEVDAFVQGMVSRKLLNRVAGASQVDDAFYTNPEARERIFELLG